MSVIVIGGLIGAGLGMIIPLLSHLSYYNQGNELEPPEDKCGVRSPKRPPPSSGGAEAIAQIDGSRESRIP